MLYEQTNQTKTKTHEEFVSSQDSKSMLKTQTKYFNILPQISRIRDETYDHGRECYTQILRDLVTIQSGEIMTSFKMLSNDAALRNVVTSKNGILTQLLHAKKSEITNRLNKGEKLLDYSVPKVVLQSGEETVQTITFSDENVGTQVQGESAQLNCLGDNTPSIELGNFLNRPVLVKEISWAMTDVVQDALTNFNPWSDYLNHALIKNKLHNYAFIRCNLRLKFVINASPFYYGCGQFSYLPLSGYKSDTNSTWFSGEAALLPHSQRRSVFIYPTNSQGGEITLPFFYNQNWLDIKNTTLTDSMGRIDFNIFNQLRSANGTAGTTLNIQVFAWAENIELMGATSRLALQSGEDEYSTAGMISKPASAIASATGLLGEIPFIGPFMTASSIIATAVGSVAHIFGYTNVPNIGPTHSYKTAPFGQMASPEISTPVEKLSFDPKNELSIDSRIDGLDGKDELDIKHIIGRDSFLTNLTVTETTSEGDTLFAARVGPSLSQSTVVSGSFRGYNLLPVTYISGLFKYWRGDMIFTFKTIASPYHKGRMRINFDPVNDISVSGSPDQMTTTFTRIIDIGIDNNVEIVVPYMQARSWLKCRSLTTTELNATQYRKDGLTLGVDNTSDNGVITCKLLTNLTSPTATTTIDVQVWVRAADNFEFGSPIDLEETFSHLVVQSGEGNLDDKETDVAGTSSGQAHPKRHLVNMGECIRSLRTLLRRPNYVGLLGLETDDDTHDMVRETLILNRYPRPYGYTDRGYSTADLQDAVGTHKFNYVTMTTMNYIGELFRGYKGSINWKFNHIQNEHLFSTFNCHRESLPFTDYYHRTFLATASDPSRAGQFGLASTRTLQFKSGASLTNEGVMPSLEICAPQYNNYKFYVHNVDDATEGVSADNSDIDNIAISYEYSPQTATTSLHMQGINSYCAIGPDFNYLYYLSIPTLFNVPIPAAI